jgi:5-methyltetrahydrofolate--homocysteine methyltransferase
VDFLLLETMGTEREAQAAAAAAASTGMEFVLSFLCSRDGRLYSGEPLEDAVRNVLPFEPAALGVNCVSPRFLGAALQILRAAVRVPICVYGNVGLPGEEKSENLRCDMDPEEYGEFAARWIADGAAVVGGCCGTTPAHIRAVADAAKRTAG